MIQITPYKDNKVSLISFLEALQDHIIQVDPLKRFIRHPDYGERYADELIDQVAKQNGMIYFAENEGKAVGMIIGIIEELSERDLLECKHSKIGTILQLYVTEEYRKQSVGSLLMDKMESYFTDQGCDVIYVGILEPNKHAHKFYKKKGYEDRVIELMKKI